MKKNILLALSFLFLINVVNALETTQQNPNSYFCDGGISNCSAIFDNNWNTNAYNPGGATGNVYLNYSKPTNSRQAIWDIEIGISASFAQQTGQCYNGTTWNDIFSDSISHLTTARFRNYSIPQDCFNQNPIRLRVNMVSAVGKFVHFYEEQIRWNTDSEEIVGFNQNLLLPQLQSIVPIDNTGLERTYLYCTWRIDGNGQEAIQMNTTLCSNPQQSFTFQNDEIYFMRIDRADIFWNTTALQWQLLGTSLVDESQINYNLDIPEPPQSLFDSIFNALINLIESILCQIFPGLGFCP